MPQVSFNHPGKHQKTSGFLDQSPLQQADYENVYKSAVYPLQFCSHRWAENKIIAESAIDVWKDIVKTVKFWMGLSKSKQPKEDNKS